MDLSQGTHQTRGLCFLQHDPRPGRVCFLPYQVEANTTYQSLTVAFLLVISALSFGFVTVLSPERRLLTGSGDLITACIIHFQLRKCWRWVFLPWLRLGNVTMKSGQKEKENNNKAMKCILLKNSVMGESQEGHPVVLQSVCCSHCCSLRYLCVMSGRITQQSTRNILSWQTLASLRESCSSDIILVI